MIAADYPYAIKEIVTTEQALQIAPLYRSYYQRKELSDEEFIERWERAHSFSQYCMLAAYYQGQAIGFIDFAFVPSIYWAPCIARIDSIYATATGEAELVVIELLFQQALERIKSGRASKIIALSCAKYEQEIQAWMRHLLPDNNPTKSFFQLILEG